VRERARAQDLVEAALGSLEEAVEGADFVVLATPIPAIIAELPALDRVLPAGAVLLDTGSVKRPVVEVMEALTYPERAVGGHPLAGSERSGLDGADPALFTGKPFAVTPSAMTSDDALARAEALVRSVGAVPVVCTAEAHDRAVAATSHLPQLVSSVLAYSVPPSARSLSGPGLADMTRLARSDPSLWRDILLSNRDNVLAACREFLGEMAAALDSVERGDPGDIVAVLSRGREAAGVAVEACS
jgi:prephenate dehydrogenase